MSLKCVLYVSESLIKADREAFRVAISQIMAECQRNNQADSITGALAYDRGRFFQFIEGPAERIDALMQRLLSDHRQTNVTIRLEGLAETRLFPKWSMALLNVTAPPVPGHATSYIEESSAEGLLERLSDAARNEAILSVVPRRETL